MLSFTGNRWPSKPPIGYGIDWDLPLTEGLVFLSPLWEGSGSAHDLVSGLSLPLSGGAIWGAASGRGLNVTSGYAQAPASTIIQSGSPITLAYGWNYAGTPASAADLFGVTYTNSNSPPYYVAGFRAYAPGQYYSYFNSGGNVHSALALSGLSPGGDFVLSASFAAAPSPTTWTA